MRVLNNSGWNRDYDLCLWADTLLRGGYHIDTLPQSLVFRNPTIPSEVWTNPMVDIRKYPNSSSLFAAYLGIDNPSDNLRLTIARIQLDNTVQPLYSTITCWPASSQARDASISLSLLDSNLLYTAFERHRFIYKSSDGGHSFYAWSQAPYHTETTDELCGNNYFGRILETSPHDTNTVFVSGIAGEREVLYKTTDNGKTWDSVFASSIQHSMRSSTITPERLYFDYNNPSTVYLRLDSAVYRSTNHGDTWEQILSGRAIHSFAVSQELPHLFAGCDSGAVLIKWDSIGNWVTWDELPTQTPVIGLTSPAGVFFTIAVTTDAVYELRLLMDISPPYSISPNALSPNPFSSELFIRLPEFAAPQSFVITDILGNTVRHIDELRTGTTAMWNGRNDSGARVAPGVYICVLSNRTGTVAMPVVLLGE